MKRKTTALLVLTPVLIISMLVVESMTNTPYPPNFSKIPITDPPSVPAIELSCPLISTGGYVNSSVEFIVTVNMPADSPAVNNISYSLDGGRQANLSDLTVTTYNDYGPTKVDFKAYKANISFKDLSEGNHTVAASANNMSTSEFFVVNSNYHITALNVLSPTSKIYTSNEVPLKFNYTGEITNAHYYLYRGKELVSDNSLSGDITLGPLPDGGYKLLVFVTTQYGQDSIATDFVVISPLIIVVISALAIVFPSIGVLVYFKKFRSRKPNIAPVEPQR